MYDIDDLLFAGQHQSFLVSSIMPNETCYTQYTIERCLYFPRLITSCVELCCATQREVWRHTRHHREENVSMHWNLHTMINMREWLRIMTMRCIHNCHIDRIRIMRCTARNLNKSSSNELVSKYWSARMTCSPLNTTTICSITSWPSARWCSLRSVSYSYLCSSSWLQCHW
jgi:hypothetical protein